MRQVLSCLRPGAQGLYAGAQSVLLLHERFIEAIATSRIDGTYLKILNTLSKIPFLILDDWGLQPLDHNIRLALLQILEDRYKKNSVIITSQLPVKDWHEYIGDPTLADAIMDRLSANMHKVELKGE